MGNFMKLVEEMRKLAVQDNKLLNARSKLNLNEKRLILFSIYLARETECGLSNAPEDFLIVEAKDFASQFNMSIESAYIALKETAKTLFNRYVSWETINSKTNKEVKFKTHWLDTIGYEDGSGMVHLRFHRDLVPLITRLSEQFTEIAINNVSKLTSVHAMRLYELIIQWKAVGRTPVFTLKELREKLGLDDSQYQKMSNFKKNVLDFAVWQISKLTDIEIYNPDYPNYDYELEDSEYEEKKSKKTSETKQIKRLRYVQKTKGRAVIGFQFNFRPNKKNRVGITVDGVAKKVTPADTHQSSNLSENELSIVMSQVEKFIAEKTKKGTKVDEKYRQNIVNKAKKERWGLDELINQADEFNAQNKKVEQKIAEDRRKQQAEKLAKKQEQQEFEQFIAEFEALSNDEREEILNALELSLIATPFLIKPFKKNRSNVHKDPMFRVKLKEIIAQREVA